MVSLRVDLTDVAPIGWTEFADRIESFYHRPEWVTTIGRMFDFRLLFLTAYRGAEIVAAMPLARVPSLAGRHRLVSFPFSYAVGPGGSDDQARLALLEAALDLARAEKRQVEIKGVGDMPRHSAMNRIDHYRTYRIPLVTGLDAVWKNLDSSSTRRGIRKAQKSGLVIERLEGEAGWLLMARFQEDTARRHGVPPPPRSFFVRGVGALARQGLATGLVARDQAGAPVGAITLWSSPRLWIYAFGGADQRRLEARPNHLLIWTAIEEATRSGACAFDLGRAAPEQEGLTEFKLRWGGQPGALAYDYWPSPRGLNVAPRNRGWLARASTLMAHLPPVVARATAPLYRFLG